MGCGASVDEPRARVHWKQGRSSGIARLAFEMAGRVAFITGAGSGLKAMAEALAGEGMKIFAVDVDGSALAALKEAFQARNVPIETAEFDVTDRDAFEAAAEFAWRPLGVCTCCAITPASIAAAP